MPGLSRIILRVVSASVAMILTPLLALGGCQLFGDWISRGEIGQAFAFFDYEPDESTLDYFVEHNSESVSVATIYDAVMTGRHVYTQVDRDPLETVHDHDLAMALNRVLQKKGSTEYENAGLEYVFGSRTSISTLTRFTPCEAVILTAMLLSMGTAAVEASGKSINDGENSLFPSCLRASAIGTHGRLTG